MMTRNMLKRRLSATLEFNQSPPHSPSVAGVDFNSFPTPNKQNVKEEDVSSGSTIHWTARPIPAWIPRFSEEEVSSWSCSSGSSPDEWNTSYEWTDEDDEEISRKNADDEMDQADKETNIMNEAVEPCQDNGAMKEYYRIGKRTVAKRTVEELMPAYFKLNKLMMNFRSERPSLKDWVSCWQKESAPAWLNVYGYYDKENNYGGYGVILRNDSVHPIIAATCFTQVVQVAERSKLLQAFKGLQTGLALAVKLAAKHQCPRLRVRCNVRRAVNVLGLSTFRNAGACVLNCSRHVTRNGICQDCTKRCAGVKDATSRVLIPFIQDLKDSQAELHSDFHFTWIHRDQNKAAEYLAMHAKKTECTEESAKEIEPVQFPEELKNILLQDAFSLKTIYSRQLLHQCGGSI